MGGDRGASSLVGAICMESNPVEELSAGTNIEMA